MPQEKKPKSQSQRFKDKARELECDESEARFERTLKHISTPKRVKPAD